MVLSKETKAQLFNIMQDCTGNDDVSYVRMLLDLRNKEIEAALPQGMKTKKPGLFGL